MGFVNALALISFDFLFLPGFGFRDDRQSMLPRMCMCVFLPVCVEGGRSLLKLNLLILGTRCPQRESKKQQAQLSLTMDLPPHQPELKRLHSVPRLSWCCFQGDQPGHAYIHHRHVCHCFGQAWVLITCMYVL